MPPDRVPGSLRNALVGRGDGRRGRLGFVGEASVGLRLLGSIALALGILAAPPAPAAQQAAKVPRIGFLSSLSPTDNAHLLEAFRQGLFELDYVEGQNIAIEYRFGEGRPERLPPLAAELVRLKVDVIVTGGPPAPEAAKQATSTIPIVFAVTGDPVAEGLVASIARPGGNITGLASIAPELVGKQLEMLKEVAPKVSRVAVLQNPSHQGHPATLRQAEGAARALGVRLHILQARTPPEIEAAFAAMRSQRAGGLLVLRDPLFFASEPRSRPSPPRAGSRQCTGSGRRRRPVASWPMERAFPICTAAPPPTWTRS